MKIRFSILTAVLLDYPNREMLIAASRTARLEVYFREDGERVRKRKGKCDADNIREHKSSSLPCQASCLVSCNLDALLRSSHNLSHRAGSLPGPLRWRRDATSSYLIRRS